MIVRHAPDVVHALDEGERMRDDVVETTFDAMSPELRALIAYDPNGALDVEVPQAALDEVRRTMPVVRWEMGVGFFGMDDVVAAGRNPDIGSVVMGMGTDDPLIPLHLDGDVHRHYRKLLDPLVHAAGRWRRSSPTSASWPTS